MNARELVAQLTLEEKASLFSGADYWHTKPIERLNIPFLAMSDGPHGLRKQALKSDPVGLHKSIPATCFPTASILACSWDDQLTREVGAAIAREAAAENVGMLLGPGLNIIRDPLSGRAFEYFSEDPFLSGKLAAGFIRGIEGEGVIATPKHFAVNSQEHMRMTIDEVVDERTLREIYLEGFRRAIHGGKPRALMTSYNRVNGTYANENEHLLQDILSDEWGFDGLIVTDWGGENDRVAGLKASNQLEMPGNGGLTDREISAAVREGTLDGSVLNERVESLLRVVLSGQANNHPKVSFDTHHDCAVEAAERSIVLLQNNDDVLPLAPKQKVALIGDFARDPRYQGAGSSLVNPTKLLSLLDIFEHEKDVDFIGFARGFTRRSKESPRLIREAKHLAQRADVVVLCLGLDEAKEAEGVDRTDMKLNKNQVDLARELAKVHHRIVVVYAGGGPVEMPFADDVSAIVNMGLAGQGGAEAVANILMGRTNPSGKLAQSWPLKHEHTPAAPYFPGRERTAEHREGLFVGYRYYDTTETSVLFPFGHGMSYTQFAYSHITTDTSGASFTVQNIGDVEGSEVAQVYIGLQTSAVFRPTHELKGFTKVTLKPGESRVVTIKFDERAFQLFDPTTSKWRTEQGKYTVEVGSSSRDIRFVETVQVAGEVIGAKNEHLDSYVSGGVHGVTDVEFTHLLGRTPPAKLWSRTKTLTIHDTIAQLQFRRGPSRFLYDLLRFARWVLLTLNRPLAANNLFFVINMPFAKIPSFTGGRLSLRTVRWLFRLQK